MSQDTAETEWTIGLYAFSSDAPSYDMIAKASLSFIAPSEILLCIVVNEGLAEFGGQVFERIANEAFELHDWTFGLAFADRVERQPDFHVLGLDNGKLGADEQTALNAWYMAQPEVKFTKLRGVYPLMLLNEQQRKQPCGSGKTLGEYIEAQSAQSTEQRGKLLLWRIPPEDIEGVRAELSQGDALIG